MPMSPYYRALREYVGNELLLIPAVAAVLRDDQERVLVQRTHDGAWSLPAGAIEPGEAPAQAIVREVLEETGLLIRAERVLAVLGGSDCRVTYPNGHLVEYVVTVFACARISGSLIDSNDETAFLRWFAPDEIPSLLFPYPDAVFRADAAAAHFSD